eukprot:357241-Chlamydomonas_euryale.AAC.20
MHDEIQEERLSGRSSPRGAMEPAGMLVIVFVCPPVAHFWMSCGTRQVPGTRCQVVREKESVPFPLPVNSRLMPTIRCRKGVAAHALQRLRGNTTTNIG